MKKLLLHSSNGMLHVNVETGEVIASESRYDGDELRPIERIDIAEWCGHYKEPLPTMLDILDVGYWHRDAGGIERYEPPAHDWRAEFRPVPAVTAQL